MVTRVDSTVTVEIPVVMNVVDVGRPGVIVPPHTVGRPATVV
jgi:hypothetical protein